MLPENRQALMRYRLSMAKERLDSSKLLLEHASYKDSIGRSYYAMFTAVRAILALDGVDFKKHAGVISYFQREYVKTKIFDVKYSKYLSQAFRSETIRTTQISLSCQRGKRKSSMSALRISIKPSRVT